MNAELLVSGGFATGSVLAGGGVSILAIELLRGRGLANSVLGSRWTTWLVLAPIWLIASVSPWGRAVVLTGAAVAGMREYGLLRKRLRQGDRRLLIAVAITTVPLTAVLGVAAFAAASVLAATILPLVSQDVRNGSGRIADQVMGIAIVAVPVALLWEIGDLADGGVFFALGLSVAMSDVGAFVAGRSIGGRRLAPILSPGKTRAGLLGNLAGAGAGSGIAAAIGAIPVLYALSFPLLIAIGSVWGDLLESLLKREAGVKDAGSWLPGFGGLLDRIDSLLVVAPLAYVFIIATGGG